MIRLVLAWLAVVIVTVYGALWYIYVPKAEHALESALQRAGFVTPNVSGVLLPRGIRFTVDDVAIEREGLLFSTGEPVVFLVPKKVNDSAKLEIGMPNAWRVLTKNKQQFSLQFTEAVLRVATTHGGGMTDPCVRGDWCHHVVFAAESVALASEQRQLLDAGSLQLTVAMSTESVTDRPTSRTTLFLSDATIGHTPAVPLGLDADKQALLTAFYDKQQALVGAFDYHVSVKSEPVWISDVPEAPVNKWTIDSISATSKQFEFEIAGELTRVPGVMPIGAVTMKLTPYTQFRELLLESIALRQQLGGSEVDVNILAVELDTIMAGIVEHDVVNDFAVVTVERDAGGQPIIAGRSWIEILFAFARLEQ